MAMRRVRVGGAAAAMAAATSALSMLVPMKAAAAMPISAGRPLTMGGAVQSSAGAGRAGPNGRSPRRVTRWA